MYHDHPDLNDKLCTVNKQDFLEPMAYEDRAYTDAVLSQTIEALSKGQIILFPTDTVWGLGCDIENASAVQFIRQIKKAPVDHAMVLLVNSIQMLHEYVRYIHPRVETLLEYHIQPLTIIYDANKNVPDYLLNSDKRIAIRLSQSDFCNELIFKMKRPLLATAAYSIDEKCPKNFAQINANIRSNVDYIVPFGQESFCNSRPSIMATFNEKGELHFLRK